MQNKGWFLVLVIALLNMMNVQAQDDILTAEKLWKIGRIGEINVSPNGKTMIFSVTYYDLQKNSGSSDLYLQSIDDSTAKALKIEGSEFNPVWRPDGKKIGYISTHSGSAQLWEMNPDGSNQKQISNINGGISGFAYAPSMDKIVYVKDVKLDKTPQEIHSDLPNANVRIIDDLMYRHWNNWHDYKYSHLFIAPYTNGTIGKSIDILKDEPYDAPTKPWGGMEEISWSPDGKYLAYTCKKLSGKDFAVSTNTEIYLYNVDDHTTKNITKEGFEGYDKAPTFSPDGSKIAFWSMERAGFEADKQRIMIYDVKSNKIENLSKDFDQSSSNFIWSKDNVKLYFISGYHATHQIYYYDFINNKINQVTEGDHDYQSINHVGNYIIAKKMTMAMPSTIYKVANNGNEEKISHINDEFLSKITMGKFEKRWITTTDGKKMLTWVIYPPHFDANKKYPALLYTQGGPQSAVSQFFSYRWNFQMMVAHDYIVVAPNRRGLPSFGQEWNDQISLDYGGQNMKDYLSAIDEVAKEPFVNDKKLGAVGASYGGFSVYWLAGHHDKRFSAFISHCGMYNFESWYGSTEEYWFPNFDLGGPYWQNPKPESYKFSPHKTVQNWDTPILIIAGGKDFRIPYTQSMEAFQAAQLQNIPSRFLYFPEESHFVTKPQNSVLWQREFFKWLDKWLK